MVKDISFSDVLFASTVVKLSLEGFVDTKCITANACKYKTGQPSVMLYVTTHSQQRKKYIMHMGGGYPRKQYCIARH